MRSDTKFLTKASPLLNWWCSAASPLLDELMEFKILESFFSKRDHRFLSLDAAWLAKFI
jgi:hypothetical protein